MINKNIQEKLKELRELCLSASGKETVSFNFFLNHQGWSTETNDRSPDSLKNEGISMRNLNGNFIK